MALISAHTTMANQSKTSIAMQIASTCLVCHVNAAAGPTVPREGCPAVASSQESKVGHSVEAGL